MVISTNPMLCSNFYENSDNSKVSNCERWRHDCVLLSHFNLCLLKRQLNHLPQEVELAQLSLRAHTSGLNHHSIIPQIWTRDQAGPALYWTPQYNIRVDRTIPKWFHSSGANFQSGCSPDYDTLIHVDSWIAESTWNNAINYNMQLQSI